MKNKLAILSLFFFSWTALAYAQGGPFFWGSSGGGGGGGGFPVTTSVYVNSGGKITINSGGTLAYASGSIFPGSSALTAIPTFYANQIVSGSSTPTITGTPGSCSVLSTTGAGAWCWSTTWNAPAYSWNGGAYVPQTLGPGTSTANDIAIYTGTDGMTLGHIAILTAGHGGTGLDTSALTGIPSLSTGTWSVGNPPVNLMGSPTASVTWTNAATQGFNFAGTAPASSASAGTAAGTQFSVAGAAGGATSSTSASTAAGIGAALSYVAGAGGAATGAGTTSTVGGAGGAVTITAGTGGAGTAGNDSGGAGGVVSISSGAGGAKSGSGTAGAAGYVQINGLTVSNGFPPTIAGGTDLILTAGNNDRVIINANNNTNAGVSINGAASICLKVVGNSGAACTATSGFSADIQGTTRHAGHVFYHTTAPVVAGTGCTIVTGSVDQRGAITLSAGSTSCTVTFASAFSNPMPMVSASALTVTPVISSITTGVLTIGVSAASGTVYYYVDDVD